MMLMIIIHTLARMCCQCRRAWPLYTIVMLFIFDKIDMVKYALPSSSAITATTTLTTTTTTSTNNNNFRNDSQLLVSYFGHTAPVNTMPHMGGLYTSSTNRGGGRTILSHSRNGLPIRSNKWSSDGRLIRTGGDIILGGIFPMHEHNINNPEYPCGMVKEEKGIQRLEAMMYALDKINKNDDDLLPNVTLGSLIIDSCSSDTYALEQSMEFVRYYMNQDMSEYKCENGKPPTFIPHKPVAGVIGASFSVVSIMVANILRLFRIPQISYASTSTELSDKSRFEYFSRVVPPDNYQAQAIAEIVKSFDWRYTSTVAVEGEYGEKGIASFIQTANALGICVAVSEKVSRHSKPEDFDRIIERLYSKPQARVVVMFVDEDNIRKILQASIRANKTGHFIFVGSDSWGAKSHPVRDQEFAAVNTITVLPQRTNLDGFDEYYKSLRPRLSPEDCTQMFVNKRHPRDPKLQINCRNIWFNEFWGQHHKCSFVPDERLPRCTGNETLTNYEQEGLVPFVVDAVYAMAHALHKIMKENCKDLEFSQCDALQPGPAGPDLLRAIRDVNFIGMQGTQIRFNKHGDAYGYYNIYQYQRAGKKYDYIQIGTWKESLDLRNETLRWENDDQPKSICSEPCPAGHVHNHQDQCCWSCVKCREEFEFVKNDTCISCEPGYAPNERKNGCDKLRAEVIDWLSPWAYVPLIFASAGILATTFTICVFIKFNHTPVIMASGRELCYVLLTGVCLCYVMTFIILARPTVIRCALLRVGLGLCLSLCYSAIFVKTNRISRIFNCGVKAVSRPIYTSPISQIAICLCIVSVQLVGTAGWLVYEVPDIKEIHPQPLTAVLTCKVSTFSLIMSLVYNMVLILLCTLYAFKTRKIPENFNEAKYIGFTMYSTCIVWLAFLPIYFGTNNDYKIQVSSMCMCLMISATVSLTCLFLPKVYLVLFQPYKNVRNATGLSVNRLAATDSNRQPNNMRFSGTRSQTFCHSMTSSAITKSGSSSRLSHRVVNNTMASDDAVDISVQTDQEQQPQQIQIEPQGNAQLTISAVVDAATELPCCSRTLTETNQPHVANNEGPVAVASSPSSPSPPSLLPSIPTTSTTTTTPTTITDVTAAAATTKSMKENGHKSISTTENTHNTDASDSISRVSSSNSVYNQNRKSSINLEPGFIETIMDDYIRKTN